MIEMKVGQHYQVNIFRGHTLLGQIAHQFPRSHVEDGPYLLPVFGSYASVHQDVLAAGADEQAVKARLHPILAVGSARPAPDSLGHYPKHRAAVHADSTVADQGKFSIAQLHCCEYKGQGISCQCWPSS
jgi:hypothetical protein